MIVAPNSELTYSILDPYKYCKLPEFETPLPAYIPCAVPPLTIGPPLSPPAPVILPPEMVMNVGLHEKVGAAHVDAA